MTVRCDSRSVAMLDDPMIFAATWMAQGRRVAVATVVETAGSAPRPVGSRLVVDEAGHFEGSVSAGCVENAVLGAAAEAIRDGKARKLSFGSAGAGVFDTALSCGGVIGVLVEPLSGAEPVAAPAPQRRLIVVGAVHIAQCLAPIAKMADFAVTIVDPRAAYATEERFPGQSLSHDWPDDALAALRPDADTAVAVLSHDAKIDDAALLVALRSPAFYVGALGSRRSQALRLDRLREAGLTEAENARLHGPIGLDIGARGPAEIAVSIMAEIIATLRAR